ncbi:MAG TPA: prepilin-type N-terminal cleavage/methylation domain-containing protein, partial [Thermoanaerobaculia bacterium]|nr:prepilin-type N-terminal cleavage/methylation domain-containing protein [Thermoanaerobaculia bacterium]
TPRGISLPEILVVVALFGILALIGGMPFLASLKRQRLGAASANLQGFCQRAHTEMQRRNVVVFLRLETPDAKGDKAVQLWADTNPLPSGDGVLDTGRDTLVDTLVVPKELAFSTTAVSTYETTNWSGDPRGTEDATARVLAVDFLGRTINPATGRQIADAALLPLTHEEMIAGSLRGFEKYELRISPVWNATVQTYIYDDANRRWKAR